jgi:transposase
MYPQISRNTRKTQQTIDLAQTKIRREAARKGKQVQEKTLEFAKYIILFTTFPFYEFTHISILEWYRARWQVELVFKRFKSIAQFGHLPKYDDESAKAWIYGKLFVALLIEKLTMHARIISPWGCLLEESPTAECLEGIRIRS